MTTQELNSKLEILKLSNVKFYNKSKTSYINYSGYSLFIEGKGLIRFIDSSNQQENEFKLPYYPVGKRKALQSIIDDGGFLDYDTIEFVWTDSELNKICQY